MTNDDDAEPLRTTDGEVVERWGWSPRYGNFVVYLQDSPTRADAAVVCFDRDHAFQNTHRQGRE